MSQSAKHALRNTIVSRSTVSKKIKVLNGSINEVISKSSNQPDILYIEMDEIHVIYNMMVTKYDHVLSFMRDMRKNW